VLGINLKGAFNCSKAAVRPMMKQRSGRIVNISSVSGLAGQAGQTNYSSSKAGLSRFYQTLAPRSGNRAEISPVNAVAPGWLYRNRFDKGPAGGVEGNGYQKHAAWPLGRAAGYRERRSPSWSSDERLRLSPGIS